MNQGDILDAAPVLRGRLELFTQPEYRFVFFAGMPGTGKSLLVQQLARIAHAAGREVFLLQWDIARPAFEASDAGRAYPQVDGRTHALIRRAAGLWVREAVASWSAELRGATAMLIGEVPLVGNRFVELAQRRDDAAEAVLSAPDCRFVLTLPSSAVKQHIEAERLRRAAAPLDVRELEDAPPHLLAEMWRLLLGAARGLGIEQHTEGESYDARLYREVYERLLRHRRLEVLALDTVLPAGAISPYDIGVPHVDLMPTADEATSYIRATERLYPDAAMLERDVERWWDL
jgi:hypothetical protein